MTTNQTSPALPPPDTAAIRRSRQMLVLMFSVFAAPIVVGTIAFFMLTAHPEGRGTTARGNLLSPAASVAWERATLKQGTVKDQFTGHWWLVARTADGCATGCAETLAYLYKARTSLGKFQSRVGRLMLTSNASSRDALTAEQLRGAIAADGSAMPWASPLTQTGYYVLDTRGFVVLQYPLDTEPKNIIKDFERLLRYSAQG